MATTHRTRRIAGFIVGGLACFALGIATAAVMGSLGSGSSPALAPTASIDKAETAGSPDAATEYGTQEEAMGTAVATGESRTGDTAVSESTDALIITTAALSLRVDDVDQATEDIRSLVTSAGGQVSALSVSAGDGSSDAGESSAGPASAVLTVRVPASALPSLESSIDSLGAVLSRTATADDVTEQAIDLEARLKNLRAEEERLRTFLDRTDKVSDLLKVEAELSRVRGEIESMDAQLTYLQRQAARATLTITLTEPGPVAETDTFAWRLREAFGTGVRLALAMVTVLVALAAPLTLVALVAVVIYIPARAIARRRARDRGEAADAPDGDQEVR